MKVKCLGKLAISQLKLSAKTKPKETEEPVGGEAAAASEEWPGGELVGLEVRIVCESLSETYQSVGTAVKQNVDLLEVQIPGSWSNIVARAHQVELHPPLVEFTRPKSAHLVAHELDELCARFPDLDELKKEGAESRLTGEHVLLGSWLLGRDLNWNSDGCEFVVPHVVACFADGQSDKEVSEDDREKAKQIILRKFSRFGALGLPHLGQRFGRWSRTLGVTSCSQVFADDTSEVLRQFRGDQPLHLEHRPAPV